MLIFWVSEYVSPGNQVMLSVQLWPRCTCAITERKFKSMRTFHATMISKNTEMKDEYGNMDDSGKTFSVQSFPLENGYILKNAKIRYNSYGKLNAKKDNVMVVCHALTGNASLHTWWGDLLGKGKPFDTSKYFIVCANVLGSCYGSSGPNSINPYSGKPYGIKFPTVTIRDTVMIQMNMLKYDIGASSVACVIGGSMGGMQALEWAYLGEDYVRSAIMIGCGSTHSAWQISISEAQRQAIYADEHWNGGFINPQKPVKRGLSVARQFAMITYRTSKGYQTKFGRKTNEKSGLWEARCYLEYQGEKFLDRFDAVTYVKLTEQMDTHDIGRGRGGVFKALNKIICPTLIMGIDSDVLYPLYEQEELVNMIPTSRFKLIYSINGHDGFLLEQDQIIESIQSFLS